MERIRISGEIECVHSSPSDGWLVCSGIIINSHPQVIIDICLGDKSTRELLNEIDPRIAIITHFHMDHSAMLSTISESTRANIFIPQGEDKYLTGVRNYVEQGIPNDVQLQKVCEQILIESGYREIKNYNLYSKLADFDLPDTNRMQVIRTPGHTPGHTSFYFPEEKLLFPGDIGLDIFGPWYAFQHCNLLEYIDSLLRLMTLDIEIIVTSHGGVISKHADSALRDCLKTIYDRENNIREDLEKGYSRDEIVRKGVLYGDKDSLEEPTRSIRYNGDEMAFDHHRRLLEDGGILKHFPQIYSVLHN